MTWWMLLWVLCCSIAAMKSRPEGLDDAFLAIFCLGAVVAAMKSRPEGLDDPA